VPSATKSCPSPRTAKAVQIEPERWKKGIVKQTNFKSGIIAEGAINVEMRGKVETVMR